MEINTETEQKNIVREDGVSNDCVGSPEKYRMTRERENITAELAYRFVSVWSGLGVGIRWRNSSKQAKKSK